MTSTAALTASASSLATQPVALPPGALLSPEQAARYLLLSVSTLARMRIAGNGPQFVRVSPQRVGYRVSDLDKYLEGRTRTSTAQS